jgi:hypothetical protein
MRTLLKCLILAMCAFPAFAQDASSLKLKPKYAPQTSATAPFVVNGPQTSAAVPNGAEEGLPVAPPLFTPSNPLAREPIPGSCNQSSSAICYDYGSGKAVFKPARELMPEISGMRRESLTLKRDRITFNYSFK